MDGRRWSSHQPNVSGRGIVASYSARFWVIVVVLGVATGAVAAAFGELLRLVEHIASGNRRDRSWTGSRHPSDGATLRR